jgi:hypothetical protein
LIHVKNPEGGRYETVIGCVFSDLRAAALCAQDNFPNKPIRNARGPSSGGPGATDFFARAIGQKMAGKSWDASR